MDLKPDSSSSSEGGGDRGMNIGDRPSSSVLMENRRLSIPPVSRIPFQFILSITGRVEGAEIFGINDIYCKYSVVYGQDWELTGVSIDALFKAEVSVPVTRLWFYREWKKGFLKSLKRTPADASSGTFH